MSGAGEVRLREALVEARRFIHDAQYRTMASRRRSAELLDIIDVALSPLGPEAT